MLAEIHTEEQDEKTEELIIIGYLNSIDTVVFMVFGVCRMQECIDIRMVIGLCYFNARY
jgi:hypothetical protein